MSNSNLNAVIGFAGGGGIEIGMLEAGFNPVLSLEFDPENPQLSNAIADVHQKNFQKKILGHKLLRQTVQQWTANKFPKHPSSVFLRHDSTSCKDYSIETRRGDLERDISAAVACADYISEKQPQIYTLENVPRYKNSLSWKIIYEALIENGYMPNTTILDFSDYGVPQSRKRFICVAMKDFWFPIMGKVEKISWYEAVKDLLPTLKETNLTNNQQLAIDLAQKQWINFSSHLPILIPRIGYREIPRITSRWKPCPTIKRSLFDDGKGSGRSQVWTIWTGKKALNCSLEVFKKLQTFPDWYEFPDDIRVAGSIIGNSVPPLFAQKLYSTIYNVVSQKKVA